MKLLLSFFFSFVVFSAFAQTKAAATAQQSISFRMLPVAVVERVSAHSSATLNGTNANSTFVSVGQKWIVQSKKLTAKDEQTFAMFSTTDKNNHVADNFSSLQLYTMSKP